MAINFIKIRCTEEARINFPEFYAPEKLCFEINKDGKPIGFYGIKKINNEIGEISVYFSEEGRRQITKGVAIACLRFPFLLKFRKIFISTELPKVARFLKKMTKFGVKYLMEHNHMHWFEMVNPEASNEAENEL